LNRNLTNTLSGGLVAGVAVCLMLLLCPLDLHAAEDGGSGRKIYDTVMLWINFGILVFVFVKYARPALMVFLHGERDKVEKTLQAIEEDLNLSKKRVEEESKNLDGIEDYLQQIRTDILEMGEREKNRVLQEAKTNADQMIRDAENELDLKMEEARRTFNDRLVEKAVDMAREKLALSFDDQDNKKQIDGFVGDLHNVKKHGIFTAQFSS
jgi:F-type H+-transporting ATPase subunit b